MRHGVIPAGTFTNLEQVTETAGTSLSDIGPGEYHDTYIGWYKVQQWVYFDVSITLSNNQTLAYGNSSDTVAFGYEKSAEGPLEDGHLYNNVWKTPTLYDNLGIYFDVIVME